MYAHCTWKQSLCQSCLCTLSHSQDRLACIRRSMCICRDSVCSTSHVSFLCIPVQPITSKDYFYSYHKYISTSHRIVRAFTLHLLDSNIYTSTVMQYTTRHLPTGTACISHLHTPHQHGLPSCLDTSTVSASLTRRSTGTHNPGIELEPLHS
jgi:hypothetical protein